MVELDFVTLTLEHHPEFATELFGDVETAEKWIKRVENNSDIRFPWIALDALIPVAYTFIRDNHRDGLAEIHIAVSRKWRNRGYGKRMVYTAVHRREIRHCFSVIWTYAENDNIAAVKCFLDNGFEVKKEDGSHLVVSKRIQSPIPTHDNTIE